MPRAPRSRGRILLATALAAGGVTLLGGALAAARDDASRIPEGVTIGGLDVGGLDTVVARSAVSRHARTISHRTVSITTPDRPGFAVRVSPALLGARPGIDEAISQAARADGFGHRVLGLVGLEGGTDVPLRFTFAPGPVDRLVDRVQAGLGRRPRPATVRVEGARLRIVPGRAGLGVDEAVLLRRLATLPERISLPVSAQPPQVDLAEAERARAQAQALLDAPPTVTSGRASLTMRPADLRAALRFRASAPRLEVSLDPDALARPLRAAFGDREVAVRDARIVPSGELVQITADRPGRRIDMEAAATALAAAPGGTAVLPIRAVRPTRTAQELRALGIRRQVSEFNTPYACCQPRVTNIQRAAGLLDGTIIPAGARFSLNEALGRRTLERGFVSAPQIAGGRFEEAVGGGVSQVATTLYNAAFFAGLEIVTHTPHEFYITRYPPGREATLSWGGPELIIRNDWPAAVYLSVTATTDRVSVRMYSDPLGRRVETTTDDPTDRVQPEVKRTEDPTLPPGEEVVDQPMGGSGFTISYTRRVFRGTRLLRDERWTWRYRPENALLRVGPSRTTTGPAAGGTGTAPSGVTAPSEPQAPDTSPGTQSPPPG